MQHSQVLNTSNTGIHWSNIITHTLPPHHSTHTHTPTRQNLLSQCARKKLELPTDRCLEFRRTSHSTFTRENDLKLYHSEISSLWVPLCCCRYWLSSIAIAHSNGFLVGCSSRRWCSWWSFGLGRSSDCVAALEFDQSSGFWHNWNLDSAELFTASYSDWCYAWNRCAWIIGIWKSKRFVLLCNGFDCSTFSMIQ